MYEINTENRFYRVFAIITDKYGIDPLRDKIVMQLKTILDYKNHEVTQDERGSPDLISFREYGNEQFWWHILAYNGIGRHKEIVEGLSLKIPSYGSLIAITNDTVSDVPPDNPHIVEL